MGIALLQVRDCNMEYGMEQYPSYWIGLWIWNVFALRSGLRNRNTILKSPAFLELDF